jgi:hypothetical protein
LGADLTRVPIFSRSCARALDEPDAMAFSRNGEVHLSRQFDVLDERTVPSRAAIADAVIQWFAKLSPDRKWAFRSYLEDVSWGQEKVSSRSSSPRSAAGSGRSSRREGALAPR